MRLAAGRPEALKQRLIALAALLAGAVTLYGWFSARHGGEVEAGPAHESRGYYLTDTVLTEMGQDGKPRVVVHAKSIEQQLPDESVLLSDLQLDYTGQQAGQWRVTSREGRMSPDHNTLQLSGDVRVTGTEARGAAVITTERLSYDTRKNFIQTPEPVSIRFGPHQLHGRGIEVDLNRGTVKLESNVNGRFTP